MKKSDPLQKLSSLLQIIQETSFREHENLEKRGEFPILDLERCMVSENRRFDIEVRATVLWNLLLFTPARIRTQKTFQNAVMAKLPSAESSLIVRQLMCRPARVWSYRKSYCRGFAHAVAGPNAHSEISIDGCLQADGTIETADHLYALGWTVSFEDHIYLICGTRLSQEQCYIIENTRPFPMPQQDDDFWEESLFDMIRQLYDPKPLLQVGNRPAPETTDYHPERDFALLRRVLLSTLGGNVVRTTSSLQITVASEDAPAILSAVDALVSANLEDAKDAKRREYLRHRILEAVGCDDEGSMPHAHISLLTADPVALLLLDPELPLFSQVGSRDSIRQALNYDEANGTTEATEAFAIYQRERRWLSAFPCFDFSIEDHALRFGIPVDALHAVFAPALFEARLPIAPQGDFLRQLQNKSGLYLPDAETPTFQTVLKAVTARTFPRNGNMSAIVQWVMNCCDRWRYCQCQIEPDTAQRTVNRANQQLLHKGLQGLSAMFKKK